MPVLSKPLNPNKAGPAIDSANEDQSTAGEFFDKAELSENKSDRYALFNASIQHYQASIVKIQSILNHFPPFILDNLNTTDATTTITESFGITLAFNHRMIARCLINTNSTDEETIMHHFNESQKPDTGEWEPYNIQIDYWQAHPSDSNKQKQFNLLWTLLHNRSHRNLQETAALKLFLMHDNGSHPLDDEQLTDIFSLASVKNPSFLMKKAEFMQTTGSPDRQVIEIFTSVINITENLQLKACAYADIAVLMKFSRKRYPPNQIRDYFIRSHEAFNKSGSPRCLNALDTQFNLACILDEIGDTQSTYEALEHYRAVEKHNHIPGTHNLAFKIFYGENTKPDKEQGLLLFIKTIDIWEKSDNRSLYTDTITRVYNELGCYYFLLGESKTAEAYFSKSYDIEKSQPRISPQAQSTGISLALLQTQHHKAHQALTTLTELVTKSDNPGAYAYLAHMHEKGIGTEKNITIAKKYHILALQHGWTFAAVQLLNIALSRDGKEQIFSEATELSAIINKLIGKSKNYDDPYLTCVIDSITDLLQYSDGPDEASPMSHALLPSQPTLSLYDQLLTGIASKDELHQHPRILKLISELTDAGQAVSSWTLTNTLRLIGELYDKSPFASKSLALEIIKLCANLNLDHDNLTIWEHLNIFNGLKHLRISPDHPEISEIIDNICASLCTSLERTRQLPLSALIFLINAMTKLLPCQPTSRYASTLQLLINSALKGGHMKIQGYKAHVFLYSLAVVHHSNPSIYDASHIACLLEQCCADASALDDPYSQSQIFFALSYFDSNNVISIDHSILSLLQAEIEKTPAATHLSQQQRIITELVKETFTTFTIEPEAVLGGLPVDIWIKELQLVIQVNGPWHYNFDDDRHVSKSTDTLKSLHLSRLGYCVVELPLHEKPEKTHSTVAWLKRKIKEAQQSASVACVPQSLFQPAEASAETGGAAKSQSTRP